MNIETKINPTKEESTFARSNFKTCLEPIKLSSPGRLRRRVIWVKVL